MRQYRYSGESRGFMVESKIKVRIYYKPEEEKLIVKDYKERQRDKIPIGQVQFLYCRIHEGEPTTPARVFEITAPDPVTYLWGEDCSTQIYFSTYEETKSILQKRVNEYEKAINWGQSINEAEYEVVRRAIHDETLTCEYDAVKIMEVQEPEIYFAKKITLYDAMWIFLTVKAEKVLFQSGRVDIEQMLVKRNNRYYHCIKPSMCNLQYLPPNGEWTPCKGVFDGTAGVLYYKQAHRKTTDEYKQHPKKKRTVKPADNNNRTNARVFITIGVYNSLDEGLEAMRNPDTLDFFPVAGEILGSQYFNPWGVENSSTEISDVIQEEMPLSIGELLRSCSDYP